jgi:hypothetical protein
LKDDYKNLENEEETIIKTEFKYREKKLFNVTKDP